jgi:RNA polymerase sigma-B factor
VTLTAQLSSPAPETHVGAAQRREAAHHMFERLVTLEPGSAERRDLRDELVRLHLPLSLHFARRYTGRREPFDDLAQAAAVGLVNAVDRYDPGRGVAFSTFAAPTILGELRRHFRDRTWAVHVHRSLQVRTGDVTRAGERLRQALGRSPTVPEVAAHLQLSEEQVVEAMTCSTAYRSTSLQTPISDSLVLGDRLGAEDPAYESVETHEALGTALAGLSDRERRLVQLRFYGNLTQVQIAEQLGISQMHVSRLLARTLERLRDALTCD